MEDANEDDIAVGLEDDMDSVGLPRNRDEEANPLEEGSELGSVRFRDRAEANVPGQGFQPGTDLLRGRGEANEPGMGFERGPGLFQEGRDVRFKLPEYLDPSYLQQGRSAMRQRLADAARSRAAGDNAGGSVASLGSAAVFGRATRRTLEEITQNEVIVRKADRGVAGPKIFVSNRTAATLALSAKFLGSVYLQSKNAAGKNNQKAKLIQEQFVSNLDVVKKLQEQMVQYDTKTPFMIPQGYCDTVGVNGWEDCWDLGGVIIDLTAN